MGRIRRWIGRHWCRDLGDLRERVQRAANDRALLQSQLVASQAVQIQNLLATIRELTEHNVHSLAEMADAHKKLLAEDLGCDLARIITTVGLVACRLDALAERMGLGAGAAGPPDGGEADHDAQDVVKIRTSDGVCLTFRQSEGHSPGCFSILVVRPRGSARRLEVPVWPVMADALRTFLARVDQTGESACRDRERIKPPE